MSRKRIVQLLTSIAVLSCMILPVQAAPQVNIVPLIQLLLLSPKQVEESVLWGLDGDGNPIIKDVFFTNEDKLCSYTRIVLNDRTTPTTHVILEWSHDGIFWDAPIEADLGLATWELRSCLIDTAEIENPPRPNPPASNNWKMIVTLDGTEVVEEKFQLLTP